MCIIYCIMIRGMAVIWLYTFVKIQWVMLVKLVLQVNYISIKLIKNRANAFMYGLFIKWSDPWIIKMILETWILFWHREIHSKLIKFSIVYSIFINLVLKSANTNQEPSMRQFSKFCLTQQSEPWNTGFLPSFQASFHPATKNTLCKTKLPGSPNPLLFTTPCTL